MTGASLFGMRPNEASIIVHFFAGARELRERCSSRSPPAFQRSPIVEAIGTRVCRCRQVIAPHCR
jgi:hypothetical protein